MAKSYNQSLSDNGIEIAAERLSSQTDSNTNTIAVHSSDIADNAELIQTKVTGPGVTVDNSVVRFSGTDGITIQPSGVLVDDNDNLKVPGGVQAQAGSTAGFVKLGGVLADHSADVGNSGTTETDLYSDTIPANALDSNGDKLTAEYGGTFLLSVTATRRIRLYFAGTAIFDSGALAITIASSWTLDATIIRVSSTIVRYKIGLATQGAAITGYTSVGELTGLTLSNDNVLKITGQSAGIGAASNDIVAKLGTIFWHPGAG